LDHSWNSPSSIQVSGFTSPMEGGRGHLPPPSSSKARMSEPKLVRMVSHRKKRPLSDLNSVSGQVIDLEDEGEVDAVRSRRTSLLRAARAGDAELDQSPRSIEREKALPRSSNARRAHLFIDDEKEEDEKEDLPLPAAASWQDARRAAPSSTLGAFPLMTTTRSRRLGQQVASSRIILAPGLDHLQPVEDLTHPSVVPPPPSPEEPAAVAVREAVLPTPSSSFSSSSSGGARRSARRAMQQLEMRRSVLPPSLSSQLTSWMPSTRSPGYQVKEELLASSVAPPLPSGDPPSVLSPSQILPSAPSTEMPLWLSQDADLPLLDILFHTDHSTSPMKPHPMMESQASQPSPSLLARPSSPGPLLAPPPLTETGLLRPGSGGSRGSRVAKRPRRDLVTGESVASELSVASPSPPTASRIAVPRSVHPLTYESSINLTIKKL
jgi:hypothetical protein